jgi:phosphatidylinositol glycan class O
LSFISKMAFMGDDTWMSVFPDSFHEDMTFPYDSFNVEDLHTVDEGVIKHLFPLLQDPDHPADFIIGHFLGVDHAGHRVGPDHITMKKKLEQMNGVLQRVVDVLDDETLLVVIGDHGMDESGDHGGDGILETSAGVWMYSKGRSISSPAPAFVPPAMTPATTFPGSARPHRYIQQVDLVPTLALMLGIPIPFNSLGSAIPELFWGNETLLRRALEINSAQVRGYLDAYRAGPSGADLDQGWDELVSSWHALGDVTVTKIEDKLLALHDYHRLALSLCRSIWAQFDKVSMAFGIALLTVGVLATWALYTRLEGASAHWDTWLNTNFMNLLRGLAGGTVLGFVCSKPLERYLPGMDALDFVLFGAPFVSCLTCIVPAILDLSPPNKWRLGGIPLTLILHSVAFTANSFTIWEDRMVNFLLMTSIVPSVLVGFSAPSSRLRNRILGFSLLFAVCVRLMAMSTICREEQQPYCHVTFFAGSTIPSPPLTVLIAVLPTCLALPYAIRRFLRTSKSDRGVAAVILPWVLRGSLLGGSAYWLLEWAEAEALFGDAWTGTLRVWRTVVARCSVAGVGIGGFVLWWAVPVCLKISVAETPAGAQGEGEGQQQKTAKQVTVLGYANSFGSPYLVFWTIFFSLLFTVTQLTGQIVLALAVVALLAHLEVVDSVRDVESLNSAFQSSQLSAALDMSTLRAASPSLKFSDVSMVALLALHAFYGTGHQSTISSIQWKAAFVLTPELTYPFSPLSVIVNFFGSFFLFALAVPLLVLWNRPPVPPPNTRAESVRAGLGFMLYYACLLLGSVASAALLRRHLMVWKVFAPRFMAAAAEMLAVQLGVLVGVGVGVERVTRRVGALFEGLDGWLSHGKVR